MIEQSTVFGGEFRRMHMKAEISLFVITSLSLYE
jgi:hypothetical protein